MVNRWDFKYEYEYSVLPSRAQSPAQERAYIHIHHMFVVLV